MWTNLTLGVVPKKISKKIFLLLAAVILIGGFFVINYVFAAHTATVTVDQTLVKGASTKTYTFHLANDGSSSNFIYLITITAPAGFTINGSLSCPAGWTSGNTASVATCTGDPDPGVGLGIAVGGSANVSFSATAPGADSAIAWSVATKDNAFVSHTYNPLTTVDATAPTISSITTKDADVDGKVDTATIVFSEAVQDSTFSAASDFNIGGSAGTSIVYGTADDNTFDVLVAGGVTGTEAKDVTYTKSAGSGADIVGNLLADVNGGAVAEIDAAKPKLMSAQTISPTTLRATFSEDLNGATVNDSGSEFNVAGTTVSAASETAPGVITLTYAPALGAGATPNVTYTQLDTLNDLAVSPNTAITPVTVTAVDGIKPDIASTRTLTTTTIEVTFTETMSAVDKTDFGVTGHTIASAVLQVDTTKAVLTVDAMGTGDTPNVTTIGSPVNTKDASTLNIITGSLSSTPTDGIAPTITSTEPAASDFINDQEVSYTLSEAAVAASGVITFTRSGGTDDANPTHTCTLQGTALNSGAHTDLVLATGVNACVDWAHSLISGTIYTVTFNATDASGNAATQISNGSVTYDTTAPTGTVTVDTATIYEGDLDQGVTVTYNENMNPASTPTITFSATTGVWTPAAGSWTAANVWHQHFTISDLNEETAGVTVNSSLAQDLAGNAEGLDTQATFNIDTINPTAPVVGTFTAVGGTVVAASINSTNTGFTLTFTSPAANYAGTAHLYVGGVEFATPVTIAVVAGSAEYTLTGNAQSITDLGADGAKSLTVKIIDAAGNIGAASGASSITKDTVVPTFASVALGADDYVNAADAAGGVNIAITTTGLEDGRTVSCTITGTSGSVGPVSGAVSSNAVTIASTALGALADGTITATCSVTDAAGNPATNGTDTATKDVVAPDAPIIGHIATDEKINNSEKAAIIVTGTAEANALVSVTLTNGANSKTGTQQLSGGETAFSVTLDGTAALPASLADGTITPSVTATDAAGNTSAADTAPTATQDTVLPTITSITSDATGAGWLKIGGTITFTLTPGSAEDGGSVTGSYNGIALTWSTADAGAHYTATYTIVAGHTDQTSALQISGVTITDANGNTSAAGAGIDIVKTIDANKPAAPVITSIATDNKINNAEKGAIVVVGTAEANALVNVSLTNGATVTGSQQLAGDAIAYSITINGATLTDGTITPSVTATDAAGNVSTAATSPTATKDVAAPTAPVIGHIATNEIIGDSEKAAIIVTGTAEANSTVNVTLADAGSAHTATGSGTATDGNFSISINGSSLNDGVITPSVTATDAAGNVSSADTDPTALKDVAAPTISSITSNATVAGWLKVSNTIIFTLTPGSAELGGSVTGSYNGVALSWSTADAGATFNATYTIAEGNTDRTSALQITGVTITDAAGNTSSAGDGSDVAKTIDGHTPVAPTTITLLDPINNANKTAATLHIVGESGTTYNYSIEDASPGSPVTGTGTLTGGDQTITSIDVSSLDNGTLTASVTLTDTAGNVGPAGTDTATKDASVPSAPTITSIAGDNYINDSEKTAVHVVGTAEANSTVSVTLVGVATAGPVTGSASGGGAYDITIDASGLTDGTITPSVTATDAAGNTSAADTDPTATKDVAAPGTPVISSIATDNVINDAEKATIVVAGTAEANSLVTVSLTNVATVSGTQQLVGGATSYSITIDGTALTDGTITPSVTATDAAGNVSTAATSPTATKDVAAPTAPTITLLDPINNANKTAATITGTGEANAVIAYTITTSGGGGSVTGAGTVSGAGSINITGVNVSALADGTLTASVTLTDAAGNTGSAGTDTATKDADAPSAPVISHIAGNEKINDSEKAAIIITGTAEANSTVNVSLSDVGPAHTVTGSGTATGGNYSITIDGSSLNDGVITPSVTATDASGNVSAATATPTADKDVVAPVLTVVSGTDAGPVKTDTINVTIVDANTVTPEYGYSDDATCNGSDTYGNSFTSGVDFSITGNRTNYICTEATDSFGNVGYRYVGQLNTDNTVPALTLNSMFTGQTLTGGNVYTISWTASDTNLSATSMKIDYSINGGSSWTNIVDSSSNDGTESWTVPSTNTSNGKVRVIATDLATNATTAESSAFSITYSVVTDSTAPVAALNSPNGGESWDNTVAHIITWTATDNITAAGSLDVKLEYSTDGGGAWTTIIADTDNDGAYSWTPTGLTSANAMIKVTATDAASLTGSDISNNVFTLATPVTYPSSICTGPVAGVYTCDIALSSGWNLVSFPIIPSNTAIATVLLGISGVGTSTVVQYYDAGTWKAYTPDVGGTLETMQDGKGYWINMTNSATLTITGTSAPAAPNPPSTYSVISGWNLIGYKSVTAYKNTSTYLSTIPSGYMVYDQNNADKTSSYLQHGKGYWLWSTGSGSFIAAD
ncbi:MAG: Ig-like domain-containing protein [Patescibacteria group bacterium]|nr:Ig-like domain-containing protein [Patescibacteria group bacterium]